MVSHPFGGWMLPAQHTMPKVISRRFNTSMSVSEGHRICLSLDQSHYLK